MERLDDRESEIGSGRGDFGTGGREPVFNIPFAVVAIIAVCTGLHLLREFVLSPETDNFLLLELGFIPARWSGNLGFSVYSLISPFTYAFLHGSIAHLLINSIWLAAFGSPLANRLGPNRFAIFWLVTSFLSAFGYFALHVNGLMPVIGASGAISGMMGAAARFGFQTSAAGRQRAFAGPAMPLGQVFRSRTVIAFLGVWFGANFLAGAGIFGGGGGAAIAWEAHIGGFLAGFFLIPLFLRR